ncbi:MAG: SprT family zinc-dependent metalloprotease [Exilibacterium sp.]
MPLSRLARLKITEIPISASDDIGFDYLLKLSPRRRTITLEVVAGKVIVRAPKGVDRQALASWVAQRRLWVLEKQQEQWQRERQAVAPEYKNGGKLKWQGSEYFLRIVDGGRNAARLNGCHLEVFVGARSCANPQTVRKIVIGWFQEQARELLELRTYHYAEQLGVSVNQVTLRRTKTKWGHCTREGNIQYNWLIAMASREVLDYLVVHEVCHRIYLDHSQNYWALVESLCPDYRRLRRWLKDQGHTLML